MYYIIMAEKSRQMTWKPRDPAEYNCGHRRNGVLMLGRESPRVLRLGHAI